MNTNEFIVELSTLSDKPDITDISNNPAVREANRLAANPRRRTEGISKLSDLVAAFPNSGNICALYAQALMWDVRQDEAISFVLEKYPQVLKKSDLTTAAGVFSLNNGKLAEATMWFLRAIAAQRGKPMDQHVLLELRAYPNNRVVMRPSPVPYGTGRAKSSTVRCPAERPRRQAKNVRRRGFLHVENVFG